MFLPKSFENSELKEIKEHSKPILDSWKFNLKKHFSISITV